MLPLNEFTPFLRQTSVFLLQTEGHGHSMTLIQQLEHANVFNVVLVVLVLGFLAKKFNLLGGIEAQRKQVASGIESVELQKKQALQQLEEAQRKTANLKAEVDEILNHARQSAELISNQILNDARSESAKIIENAKRRVEQEQRSAIKDLERRLLSDALSDARVELAGNLNAADQKRSLETFLEELSQLKEGQRL
jgi:F-type H+-transporting ATPase subunit b